MLENLTPRQRQIALMIPEGMTNREIGQKVGIQESVVKKYLKEIFDRCGVWSRMELALHVLHWEEECNA